MTLFMRPLPFSMFETAGKAAVEAKPMAAPTIKYEIVPGPGPFSKIFLRKKLKNLIASPTNTTKKGGIGSTPKISL
ncbi:hypothetical protein LguiA_030907 [Lonicera macranthoides]